MDLEPSVRRLLMSRLADCIGALDLILTYRDDNEIADLRGQVVRLYLRLMDAALEPFDQDRPL